jgi:hypothetical protein
MHGEVANKVDKRKNPLLSNSAHKGVIPPIILSPILMDLVVFQYLYGGFDA